MTESDPPGVLDTCNIVICVVLAAILFISPHPQDIKWLTSSLGSTGWPNRIRCSRSS